MLEDVESSEEHVVEYLESSKESVVEDAESPEQHMVNVPESPEHPEAKDDFKFQNIFWFHDVRPNPSGPGEPFWAHYPDHISVMLERKIHEWIQSGKNKELNQVMVNANHCIRFHQMV